MANFLYKDHLIITLAEFDQSRGVWSARADISWRQGGRRDSHTLSGLSDRQCTTREEAEAWAVQAAKAWVDEHVSGPSSKFPGPR